MTAPMPRLLIAYDGSGPARSAVQIAAALLPRAEAAVVTAAHSHLAAEVSPALAPAGGEALQELEREATAEAEEVAREGAELAERSGLGAVTASTVSAVPGVWAALLGAAEARGADVIVCGTRGRSGLGHAILGSTSAGLLHHAHGSVLVVPQLDRLPPGPAMLAFDGSAGAERAVIEAGRLLAGREAVVVHAWRSLLRETLTGRTFLQAPVAEVAGIARDLEALEQEAAQDRLEAGRALAERHGLRATARLVDGTESHWHGLLEAADAIDAAVLVAGSRGRGGIAAALLGSISSSLAHNAHRPTLIVRPAA